MNVDDFITRWKASGGSEISNFQTFANELCDLIGVPKPDPATQNAKTDAYCFERPVTFIHTGTKSHGRIDLYRAGHFVMEAKQGTDGTVPVDDNQPDLIPNLPAKTRTGHGKRGTKTWDNTMLRARNQADGYARAVSRADGWPPFLLVVDVGHVIEIYADFSGQGQGYTQFPDGRRYRIAMDDLRDEAVRDRLRAIWTDPMALDPSRTAARVTREVADRLAALGRSFEGQGHAPETVANFLMRCLFTMFAEDVDLIPQGSFTELLTKLRGHPEHAAPALKALWQTMDTGGFSPVLTTDLKKFNGGLFKDADALPLSEVQLSLLIDAAQLDWREVEPAIFGTLLERALDKKQRHKLGAHYTPRAYVERLVVPTIMEPLRDDWRDVQAAALTLSNQGKDEAARDVVRNFHRQLCEITVLDPACGSGNFLYVSLELMKRLEGEVTDLLTELGEKQSTLGLASYTVDPHQFLGLELNPWAAAVAELVLWIGYLQWHFRTHGQASPAEPVLKDFHNIENRDAVLTYSGTTPRLDEDGQPVTRWDGETKMRHPVTGEDVPDPSARVPVLDYADPKPATWPRADFIVGNPPFIGNKRMREALGDGYTEALRAVYPKMPQSADFVMFWWEKAALATRAYKPTTAKTGAKGARRFGLITTDSITQYYSRKVIERLSSDSKVKLSIVYAIPSHPWIDSTDGASTRIAVSVVEAGKRRGRVDQITEEVPSRSLDGSYECKFFQSFGEVTLRLKTGPAISSVKPLKANSGLCYQGCKLVGAGFQVAKGIRDKLVSEGFPAERLPQYLNGTDIARTVRERYVIDCTWLSEAELAQEFPHAFQYLSDYVKPERDQNRDGNFRNFWWLFGRPRYELRKSLEGLNYYFATSEVSKHLVFQKLRWPDQLVDGGVVAITLSEMFVFSVLQCRIHRTWSLAASGHLGETPRYQNATSFDPFPFPDPTDAQRTHLRALGEELDAHRKDRQAQHPKLTLTQMYNVLEKLRAGQAIEGKDKAIYNQGLIGILRDIHDRIDVAVAEAYGWPADLSDDEILHRLVDLNRERAAEEARGHIRWLRPEYQNPTGAQAAQTDAQGTMDVGPADSKDKPAFPKTLPDQIAAVREALSDLGEATPEQVARQFKRGQAKTMRPLLESLTALGHARIVEGGRFAG